MNQTSRSFGHRQTTDEQKRNKKEDGQVDERVVGPRSCQGPCVTCGLFVNQIRYLIIERALKYSEKSKRKN